MTALARILQSLGWFFCEVAFRTDDEKWWGTPYWYLLGWWSYDLGNWFYTKTMRVEERFGFRLANW